MRKQRLSDILFGRSPKVRFISLKEELMKAPSIGHYLGVMVFQDLVHLDTLFVDNIDICNSHTVIHYNKHKRETYVAEVESSDLSPARAIIYYKNNTHFEIIRL